MVRPDLAVTLEELRRVIDPKASEKTIHWGRNYLYQARLATADGESPVVVKVFRERERAPASAAALQGQQGATLLRGEHGAAPSRGSGARAGGGARVGGVARCARTFSTSPSTDALEARYFFRARNAGTEREQFPEIAVDLLLSRLGAMLRRMHDAKLWHRDVSAGNVLLAGDWSGRAGGAGERAAPGGGRRPSLYLIDLARTRVGQAAHHERAHARPRAPAAPPRRGPRGAARRLLRR